MPAIGQYAAQTTYAAVPDDIYEATICHASVVMDTANPALPATDKFGKNRLLVKFELDNEVDDAGGPVELRRQFAISYGATGGTYAALAQLIQATMGVKCGDKAQRHVTTEELVGKKLRVQTATVDKDDKTFCNVIGTFAPKKPPALAVAPAPRPAAIAPAPQNTAQRAGLEEADLADLPF